MAEGLRPSPIRAIVDRAAQLEREGRDIVHLEIGRPQAGAPEAARAAGRAALAAGADHYTANRGDPELLEALAARTGYDASSELIVTTGGSEAAAATLLALLEHGDEVIIADPAWAHYDGLVRIAGGVPVHVATQPGDGFQPDPDVVAAALTPRTRALIVSSPGNPTGAVWAPTGLSALAELCVRYDLVAFSDEIYAAFVYDGAVHVSIAALPGMRERTVVWDSWSKRYAMTGWRVGYVAAPTPLAARIAVVHQHVTICAAPFAQAGALAALREGDAHTAAMLGEYGKRRVQVIAGLPAGTVYAAQGAFYAYPRLGAGAALRILEEAGVATVPGQAFGAGYDDFLRISYAVSADTLERGLERLTRVL